MRNSINIILIVLICFIFKNSYSQKVEWLFMPKSLITDSTQDLDIKNIIFDRFNNAFIQNQKTIFKYDCKNFQIFYKDDNDFAIALDMYDNLYVRSAYELKKFNGKDWVNIYGAPFIGYGATALNLESQIMVDSLDNIWVDNYTINVDSLDHPVVHFGLSQYDGNSWITYDNKTPGFPDADYGIFKTDYNNNIWFRSYYSLAKYDRKNWISYKDSIKTNNLVSFAVDNNNTIWMQNGNFGFLSFNESTWTNFKHPTLNEYIGWEDNIIYDNNGTIWQMGDPWRLIGINVNDFTIYNPDISIITGNITSLNVDRYGNLWLGGTNGIYEYKKDGIISKLNIVNLSSDLNIRIIPNPFKDFFEIDLNNYCKNVILTIYDNQSKMIFKQIYSDIQTIKLSRNNMNSGLYYYCLIINNNVFYSGKMIAE